MARKAFRFWRMCRLLWIDLSGSVTFKADGDFSHTQVVCIGRHLRIFLFRDRIQKPDHNKNEDDKHDRVFHASLFTALRFPLLFLATILRRHIDTLRGFLQDTALLIFLCSRETLPSPPLHSKNMHLCTFLPFVSSLHPQRQLQGTQKRVTIAISYYSPLIFRVSISRQEVFTLFLRMFGAMFRAACSPAQR